MSIIFKLTLCFACNISSGSVLYNQELKAVVEAVKITCDSVVIGRQSYNEDSGKYAVEYMSQRNKTFTNQRVLRGSESVDLTGTYRGRVKISGGFNLSAHAILKIEGNDFELVTDETTYTGRIIAVTTRGYTGAALIFKNQVDSVSATPTIISVRVRRVGDHLTLSRISGARNSMSFTSTSKGVSMSIINI